MAPADDQRAWLAACDDSWPPELCSWVAMAEGSKGAGDHERVRWFPDTKDCYSKEIYFLGNLDIDDLTSLVTTNFSVTS